jgi:hypothetical protein
VGGIYARHPCPRPVVAMRWQRARREREARISAHPNAVALRAVLDEQGREQGCPSLFGVRGPGGRLDWLPAAPWWPWANEPRA